MKLVPEVRSPFPAAFASIPFVLTAVSLAALGAAYTAQYGFDLPPCELCLAERWPYGVAIALGIATRLASSSRVVGALLLAMAVCFLFDASLALFHVGVEQHWWTYVSRCTATASALVTALDVAELLSHSVRIIPCDQPGFVLFGLSMAAYNAILTFVLSSLALSDGSIRLAGPGRTSVLASGMPRLAPGE